MAPTALLHPAPTPAPAPSPAPSPSPSVLRRIAAASSAAAAAAAAALPLRARQPAAHAPPAEPAAPRTQILNGSDGNRAAAPRPLPPGASLWDRLPDELQGAIVDAAGPLTRIAAGRLGPAQAKRLSAADKQALWAAALDCGWQGDLAALPTVPRDCPCFARVRSPAMLARVRAARVASRWALQRAVVRNQWRDLLDFSDPARLATAAAEEGAVWLLEDLCEVRMLVGPERAWLCAAAQNGHLRATQWLYCRVPDPAGPIPVVDYAAESGNLDLVVWLYAACRERCTGRAMDMAAANGHIHVLRWLRIYDPRGAVCSDRAFLLAAGNGHLAVLDWLNRHFPRRLSPAVFDFAAADRHLHILLYLRKYGIAGDVAKAMAKFALVGNTAVVQWLHDAYRHPIGPELVQIAVQSGDIAAVRWILANQDGCVPQPEPVNKLPPGRVSPPASAIGRTNSVLSRSNSVLSRTNSVLSRTNSIVFNTSVVGTSVVGASVVGSSVVGSTAVASAVGSTVAESVVSTSSRFSTRTASRVKVPASAVYTATVLQRLDMVKLLYKHGAKITAQDAEAAAHGGTLQVVAWMASKAPEAFGQQALEAAATAGNLDVVEFLVVNLRHVRWNLIHAARCAPKKMRARMTWVLTKSAIRRGSRTNMIGRVA